MYHIWSNRRREWWKAERQGYTPSVAAAGIYSPSEAGTIALSGLPGANVPVDIGLAHRFAGENADAVERTLDQLKRV